MWAIPWLENDPALTACTALGRSHALRRRRRPGAWLHRPIRHSSARTKAIGPNIAALAQAAWSQPWADARRAPALEAIKDKVGAFPENRIAGTDEAPVYQTVRYAMPMSVYRVAVPNGVYTVALKLVEPSCEKAGERVFDAVAQDRQICFQLDIFAKVGKNHALDVGAANVRVTDGALIRPRPISYLNAQMEMPCVAGMVIQGVADSGNRPYVRKINFGGPAWKDYESDATAVVSMDRRTVPVADFYRDWAAALFGARRATQSPPSLRRSTAAACPKRWNWFHGPGRSPPSIDLGNRSESDMRLLTSWSRCAVQVLGGGNSTASITGSTRSEPCGPWPSLVVRRESSIRSCAAC